MPPSNNTTVPVPHQNPPTDEDDFVKQYEDTMAVLTVLYDVNVAMAVVLGLVGILMLLTLFNQKLRSNSPIWYLYHLIFMSSVTALLLHPLVHSMLIYESRGLCFFVMYTTEFFFMVVGINLLLLNTEVYFTTVLPLQKWQWSPLFRFVVSMMAGWIGALILCIYVVINNNAGLRNKYHCFHVYKEGPRLARLVLRSVVPAGLCFLSTIVLIGTHCLKRSRFMITSASGELREVRTVTNEGEMEWTRVTVYVNIVFIVRTALDLVINYSSFRESFSTYIPFMVILMIHAITFYLFPLGMLFISDARAVIKALVFKAIGLASCGKLRLGEDLEQLSVSFGQDSVTSVH